LRARAHRRAGRVEQERRQSESARQARRDRGGTGATDFDRETIAGRIVVMDRGNHYEAAFEDYLRDRALPYIGVDETRRSLLGDGPVKSLDFIVYGVKGCRLLVDVKGRRFPGGSAAKPRNVWECWSTRDDVAGLRRWAEIFGPGYEAAFVFMY